MQGNLESRVFFAVTVCLIIGTNANAAAPISTAFSYQGQLKDAGVPADGVYDLRFSLFDAASAGAAVGSSVNINDWPVVNGLFTVELDFGTNPFDGNARWLRIEVRPGSSGGGYTALTPRQPLTAVPYAMYALDGPGQAGFWQANGNNIYKTNSGNVGIGATDPQANLEIRSATFPRLRVAKVHSGGFGVAGPAVFELKSNLTGTDQPYGKVNFLDGSDTVRGSIEYGSTTGLLSPTSLRLGTAGQTRLAITDAGNVGVGTIAPTARLSVYTDTALSGNNTAEFRAPVIGPNVSHIHYGTNGDWYVRSADAAGKVVIQDSGGHVGIGTASPSVKLHVTGGTDTAPGGGGFIVTGDTSGANISIDNNEIMARNNGGVAPLHLNANGGDVIIGGVLDLSLQRVSHSVFDAYSVSVSCPAGMMVIGGGCIILDADADAAALDGSHPFDDLSGWACSSTIQIFDAPDELKAYAICAKVK